VIYPILSSSSAAFSRNAPTSWVSRLILLPVLNATYQDVGSRGLLVKPLFTVHAGEFLVDCEIERKFRRVNVWIPANDTGIDLLVSNNDNTKTVSLQVKFSRDYLVTHMKDAAFHKELRACGWWTPTRQQIEKSFAQYWVFVLVGFANRSTDFIIIKPHDLLKRLDAIPIHRKAAKKFQSYLWVTQRVNAMKHAV
jgi:hypothetical protein